MEQQLEKKFLGILTIVFVSLFMFAVTLTLVIQTTRKEADQKVVLSKEEIIKKLPQDLVIFEDQVVLSPNKKYYAALTTTDFGMKNSSIWIITSDGERRYYAAFGEEFRYISTPTWSPDSKKLAYLQIYPFELWTVNINSLEKNLLYSENDHLDNNVLNPSLGYGGKANLTWNKDNTITFQNKKSIPESIYKVQVDTKELKKISEENMQAVNSLEFTHFSQRDEQWSNEQLGGCETQTIHSAGCTISAITTMFSAFDIQTTPSDFNTFLTNNSEQGYVNGCDVRWNIVTNYQPGVSLKAVYFNENDKAILDYELEQGNAVIIGYNYVPFTKLPHWVTIEKKVGETYYVRDPWLDKTETKTLDEFGIEFDHMIVYEQTES